MVRLTTGHRMARDERDWPGAAESRPRSDVRVLAVSPDRPDYDRAVPTHDRDLFEDVDAPALPRQMPEKVNPAVDQVRVVAPPVAFEEPAPPPAPIIYDRFEPVAAPPVAVAAPPSGSGRLYRSAGATGPLAAQAIPALRKGAGSAPATAAPSSSVLVIGPSAPSTAEVAAGSVRVYAAVEDPVWSADDPGDSGRGPTTGSAPAWFAPAPPEENPEPVGSARPSLLGRPTFSRGSSRTSKRVSDGLLQATDGLTLAGEIVLVGGAATIGALMDVIFGSGIGLMTPLLLFASSLYGAWQIRTAERVMALAVPPAAFIGAVVVIGQLGLPAGHHLLTREALLLFNALSGGFLWLLVTVVSCVGILYLRSRAASRPKVTT
jgi:hypothetical protein